MHTCHYTTVPKIPQKDMVSIKPVQALMVGGRTHPTHRARFEAYLLSRYRLYFLLMPLFSDFSNSAATDFNSRYSFVLLSTTVTLLWL